MSVLYFNFCYGFIRWLSLTMVVATVPEPQTFLMPFDACCSCAVDRDGSLVAIGMTDGSLVIMDAVLGIRIC